MPRRQNESPSTAGAYSTHNSTPTRRNAHISADCPASIKETLRLSIGFVVVISRQTKGPGIASRGQLIGLLTPAAYLLHHVKIGASKKKKAPAVSHKQERLWGRRIFYTAKRPLSPRWQARYIFRTFARDASRFPLQPFAQAAHC